jgi:hypothetical protein
MKILSVLLCVGCLALTGTSAFAQTATTAPGGDEVVAVEPTPDDYEDTTSDPDPAFEPTPDPWPGGDDLYGDSPQPAEDDSIWDESSEDESFEDAGVAPIGDVDASRGPLDWREGQA